MHQRIYYFNYSSVSFINWQIYFKKLGEIISSGIKENLFVIFVSEEMILIFLIFQIINNIKKVI